MPYLFFIAELHRLRHRGLIVWLGHHFEKLFKVETGKVDFRVTLSNLCFQVHKTLIFGCEKKISKQSGTGPTCT